jgi:carbonic anhydrase/acetyltransferase-like protein (isoleucine patch superfamily)
MNIPMPSPDITPEDIAAVNTALHTLVLSIGRQEEGIFLGIGSSVIPGRRIGAWTTVGAGAAVIHDLPAQVTAVGVPAHVLERF